MNAVPLCRITTVSNDQEPRSSPIYCEATSLGGDIRAGSKEVSG